MKRKLSLALALMLLVSMVASLSAGLAEEERAQITVTVYDRGKVPADEGTIEENRWTRWINENGPVDVQFVAIPRTNPEDKLYVLFASGSAPDLVFEYSPSIRSTLYQQGQLMPIEDMIAQYSTNYKEFVEEYPNLASAGIMPDGEMYAFGKINASGFNRAVLIRQDWLDALGLDMPQTLEDYYEVCRAFVEDDPDGNGEDDTYAMAMSYRANETFNQMIYGEVIMEGDGEMRYGWDEIARRLTFQKWLYDNSYIDREYMSDTNGAKAMQDFLNGKTGILPWLTGLNRSFALNDFTTFKANNPDGKLSAAPYPEIDGVRYMPTLLNPVQMTAFVNASCENPEAVMQYVDFACSKEFAMAFTYGIEGEHYEMVDGMPVITDTEKFTDEVSWAGDYAMLKSSFVLQEYQSPTANFDLSNPIEAEAYELYKQALALYLDPSLKYPGLTHSEHMPQLPEDLAMINANIMLTEYFDRAVVGGENYSVETAIEDAKRAWTQGGGDQILDWWNDWYENDRDTAFLAEDMYEIVMAGNPLNYLE